MKRLWPVLVPLLLGCEFNVNHPQSAKEPASSPVVIAPKPGATATAQVAISAAAQQGDGQLADASSQTVQLGAIRVQVTAAVIDRVDIEEFVGDSSTSKDRFLKVSIAIRNTSTTKKVEYLGWGARSTRRDPDAKISDALGNNYDAPNFGYGTKVAGSIGIASIYPGSELVDAIAFEVPVASAEFVVLKLPAINVGESGEFQFKISRSMWTPQPEAVARELPKSTGRTPTTAPAAETKPRPWQQERTWSPANGKAFVGLLKSWSGSKAVIESEGELRTFTPEQLSAEDREWVKARMN